MSIVNWFLTNPLALVLLSGAVGGLGVAAIAWLYPILKNQEQGYPHEAEIEAALLPYALKAIAIAYKMSEDAMDDIGERMRGLDKKAIADTLYELLPPVIGGIPVGIIKTFVSREKFEELVQKAFDGAMSLYELNQEKFAELYKEWLKDNG